MVWSVFVCVCICMYEYVYLCVCVCMYAYVRVCVYDLIANNNNRMSS